MLDGYNRRQKPRTNSDVSQLGIETMGMRRGSPEQMTPSASRPGRPRSSSSEDAASTIRSPSHSPPPAGPTALTNSAPTTKPSSPNESPLSQPSRSFPSSPNMRNNTGSTMRPVFQPVRDDTSSKKTKINRELGSGSRALKGTIARATTDTTLAVIPAEAFKKLTRKFPKASGTVVQLVLERFSRVTFMTGQHY